MKKIILISFVQVVLLACIMSNARAQQPTKASLEEAKNAIAASNAIYFQAFAKGDSALFVDRYAKDCWIMRPNSPALCGPDAALDFFKLGYHKFGVRDGKFITVDVFGDGVEYATEIGFWQLFDGDHKMIDNGKFLVLWKKTVDGWKMFRDSFSSDRRK
jgi:ketosteroid isomerase-like protein